MQNNLNNNWPEWSKFVLNELERLNENYDKLSKAFQQIRVDIATLKIKAGVWGLLGGLIPIAIIIALWILKGV